MAACVPAIHIFDIIGKFVDGRGLWVKPEGALRPVIELGGVSMQRATITLDDAPMAELDAIIAARGYQNRSEAIRDLARAGIREAAEDCYHERAGGSFVE
jgi:Ribbon-helix-helix protein, copG family